MSNNFSSLGVSTSIIEAIKEMGFMTPTDVQQEVIPHILKHRDLIVMSKTGSGKTGAFGIPLLQAIDSKGHGPRGLILTPTRELAVQVDQDLKKMSKYLSIRTTAVYGQHDMKLENQALKMGADVVTGTPGRVFDHIKRRTLETKNIQFVVLDEADRMLDMGFIDQMIQIIKELPKKRVTLLFSATMPTEIKRICQSYMYQPFTIELQSETKTVDTVKQIYYRVQSSEKRMQLNRLLQVEQPERCMIFCNTRDEVDRVQAYLSKKGYIAEALHGANSQNHRMRTIQKFKKGLLRIVVATDVAARGIHIEDLSLVINYDVPNDKDSYVHRIGRTARAGNSGKAITLATSDDIMSLYEIEEHVGVLLDEETLPTAAYVKACVEKARQQKSETPKELDPKLPKQEAKLETSAATKEVVKNDEEVTIMVKNLGPVKVIYRDEPKKKIFLLTNLKILNYFSKLFKRDRSNE
ncbi:DEAD/DEAH box helicase [Cellulosilyticum sp. I15G10I2]|uniref:DEAD/DEAH box helicase n=1 Tax=Cellulosilyticum sp. I15G10I2 TaxID=1892843 RepID=UPI00085BE9FC|nr:DEAD/DEAH box helicase [Cellulosilyticum sp. I15G10I2]